MRPLVVQSPPHVLASEAVVAATRCRATGILDVSRFACFEQALHICARNSVADYWGIRWENSSRPSHDLNDLENCVSRLSLKIPTLILGGQLDSSLSETVERARDSANEIVCEVVSLNEAIIAFASNADAVILRGNEAGGRVGSQSIFILLQSARKCLHGKQYWAAGGMSLSAARAALRLGAGGVVISEALWNTQEISKIDELRDSWSNLDGSESKIFGRAIYHRLDTRFGKQILNCVAALEAPEDKAMIERALQSNSDEKVFAVGQEIAFAEPYAKEYQSVGRLVDAFHQALSGTFYSHIFHPGNSLSLDHGTLFPIVQGPMTRVSDQPEFLQAVADAGGLPFLALAVSKGMEAQNALAGSRAAMGEKPWGVGLLGFLPPAIREEQMALVAAAAPKFAIISGGKPEHAHTFEKLGIRTYLHVPSPRLFSVFLKHGARRFVLEGSECGGHIGPRSSFVLWAIIAELLQRETDVIPELSLLCAGGIHDAASACAASEIFAPLARRGAKIGVLMGSAYLFTREAVSSKAILPEYQQQVTDAQNTILLESGAGYATRCLDTPFASTFRAEFADLSRKNVSIPETVRRLELLNVGRLRLASKGLERRSESSTELRAVGVEQQRASGLYMVGEVATLRSSVVSMEELHAEIASGLKAVEPPALPSSPSPKRPSRNAPKPIAIVGIQCIFPGAGSLSEFWHNILRSVSCIKEVSRNRWDPKLYFDSNRMAADRTYSKWGGFIDPIQFDPISFGIPPASMSAISANQLLALEVSRRVLEESGFTHRPEIRKNTAVVFGSADSGDLGGEYAFRALLPQYLNLVDALDCRSKDELRDRLARLLPRWSEDSLPGILQNVVTGRISNRLDLGGTNFTVDAACATSFAALEVGVQMLRAGTCDAALVGAVDTSNSALSYLAFSKTQALSPTGTCRAFDSSADGMVLSEGVAAILLRPLEAAEHDGDRIYSVIRGIGSASDGRNKSLTSPHVDGQIRALNRAYEDAGISPSEISLVEAHGTGTVVGDTTESEGLRNVFAESAPHSVALGSVKSMIGHTKTAAGFAGLIKTVLAMDQKILPPTLGVEEPISQFTDELSPLYLCTEARPWIRAKHSPRRAGVSAFGFGGTNYHVVVEEYVSDWRFSRSKNLFPRDIEIVFMSAADRAELLSSLEGAISAAADLYLHPAADAAYAISQRYSNPGPRGFHLALTVSKDQSLKDRLTMAKETLTLSQSSQKDGIFFHEAARDPGKICFLFPGQGAQRLGMLKDLILGSPSFSSLVEEADRSLNGALPRSIADYIFPCSSFGETAKRNNQLLLTSSEIAQPSLALGHLFANDLLGSFGIRPDCVAGHSFGEYSALSVAGVFSRETLISGAHARGKMCDRFSRATSGGLMAVLLGEMETRQLLVAFQSGIYIAGVNSKKQTLVGGETTRLREFSAYCKQKRIATVSLPTSVPFHTPLMTDVARELEECFPLSAFGTTQIPVYSNVTGRRYPDKAEGMRALLVRHMHEPLLYSCEMNELYNDGCRVFVEVGPGTGLTGLLRQMEFADCVSLSTEGTSRGWTNLAELVGHLYSLGRAPNWQAWFEDRVTDAFEFDFSSSNPIEETSTPRCLVDGARAHLIANSDSFQLTESKPIRISEDTSDSRDLLLELRALRKEMEEQARLIEDRFASLELQLRDSRISSRDSREEHFPLAVPFLAPLKVAPQLGLNVQTREPQPTLARSSPNLKHATTSFRDALLQAVSKCTGYPQHLLHLHSDLQSELGVDSIKRVEIASFLLDFDDRLGNGTPGTAFEELVRLRTLQEIIDWYDSGKWQTAQEKSDRPGGTVSLLPRSAESISSIRRYEVHAVAADPSPSHSVSHVLKEFPKNGITILCGESGAAADAMFEILRSNSIEARLETNERFLSGSYDDPRGLAESEGRIQTLFRDLRENGRVVTGLIYCGGFSVEHSACKDFGKYRGVELFFTFVREFVKQLPVTFSPSAAWLGCITFLGGKFGLGESFASGGDVQDAGIWGIVKTASREYPSLKVRCVDCAPELPPQESAANALREFLSTPTFAEIGLTLAQRWLVELKESDTYTSSPGAVRRSGLSLDSDATVLVTGGLSGISGEVTLELCRRYSPKIVVVGRSSLERELPQEFAEFETESSLRNFLIGSASTYDLETPAEIEQYLQNTMKHRDRLEALSQLRRLSTSVTYEQVDTSDHVGFSDFLRRIQTTHGAITGVIHGAGVVQDRLIAEKTLASFQAVYRTKVVPLQVFEEVLNPAALEFVALFASVSGRFGSVGQVDYSAANEVLSKWAAKQSGRWPGVHVVSINWGPWQTGMMGKALGILYQDRGIELIPKELGSRLCVEELEVPSDIRRPEVVISGSIDIISGWDVHAGLRSLARVA